MFKGPAAEDPARPYPLWLYALIAGFVLMAGCAVWVNSFVADGQRYFVLMDDCMISMQYARNLAGGQGLVWNAGAERVEGITNPLWTAVMAVPHLLAVPETHTGLAIQFFEILILAVNLLVVYRLTLEASDGSRRAAAIATLMTALYFPLAHWSVVCGTEVGPLTLLLNTALLWAGRAARTVRSLAPAATLLAVCTLIRPDAVVSALAVFAALAWCVPAMRGRRLVAGAGIVLMALLGQSAARYWYYGELLPNTYWLKMTGFPLLARVGRGLAVTLKAALFLNPVLALGAALHARRRKSVVLTMAVGVFAAQCVYSVWAGGDAWEYLGGANRFICMAIPALFVAVGCAADAVVEWYCRSRNANPRTRNLAGWAVGAFCIAGMAAGTGTVHLRMMAGEASPFTAVNKRNVQWALYLRGNTPESTVVAVSSAGVLPYFSHRRCTDLLGKNDPVIARQPAHIIPGATWWGFHTGYFLPGHLKWDYARSIGQMKPDVIAGNLENPEAAAYLTEYTKVETESFTGYIRKDGLARALIR